MSAYGTAQLKDALADEVRRLRRLRCEGPQYDAHGTLVGIQVSDLGRHGTTFLWEVGETVGEALGRVDARYRQRSRTRP